MCPVKDFSSVFASIISPKPILYLLFYDITNRNSFANVDLWHKEICEELNSTPCVLIGNKLDLNGRRVVKREEGIEKVGNCGVLFSEMSAKTGENVTNAFNILGIGLFFNCEN